MSPKSNPNVQISRNGSLILFQSFSADSIKKARDFLTQKKQLFVPAYHPNKSGWPSLSNNVKYAFDVKPPVQTEEYIRKLIEEVCQELERQNIGCEKALELTDAE